MYINIVFSPGPVSPLIKEISFQSFSTTNYVIINIQSINMHLHEYVYVLKAMRLCNLLLSNNDNENKIMWGMFCKLLIFRLA